MPEYEEEKRRNLDAYQRLKDEIRANYLGQYVAIADGRLVKVSPSFEAADEAVAAYRHRLVFPAGEEPEIGPLRLRVGTIDSSHA
jgi:cytosine/adenosine deaminase-related metal-dependent hydrolase